MVSDKRLAGKTALVTGASRGIGKAIAEAFSMAGSDLVLIARSQDELSATALACARGGAKVVAETVDLGDTTQIDELFSRLLKRGVNLDILINCAAIMIKGLLDSYSVSDFERMFAVNVTAPMLLSQKAIPKMRERGGGTIVNISSLSGCFGVQKFPGFGPYDMTKYALWGLTEMLAIENMKHNIRVNQVSLSAVDTQMYRSVAPAGLKANLTAEDVAKHVLYLASSDSEPLTGENIILTGMAPAR
jgi:NAD(P)-dependent dehydrogenase (short-subunit alcohol dehydrogenase family)